MKIRHKIEGNIVTFYNDAPTRVEAGGDFQERVLSVDFTERPTKEEIEKVAFAIQHRSKNWTPDHKFVPYSDGDCLGQCKVCAHFQNELFHIKK